MVSPAGLGAADVAGLTPEQITQLMNVEATREKLRLGGIGAVYDALYKQAAAGKLAEETRLAPRVQRLAEITEQRSLLEAQRKEAKTAADLEKIDAEVKKLDLEKQKLERLKGYVAKYGDRMVEIPGVGKMSVGHIIDFRPELLDKLFNVLEKDRLRLEEARFLSSERKDLWDNVLQELGVADFFGLRPEAQDKFLEIARRGYDLWKKGKGIDPYMAAVKAAKEGKASFEALKKIEPPTRDWSREFPFVETGEISESAKARTREIIKEAVKAQTLYSEILRVLVEHGWSEEEARDVMKEALKPSGT